LKKLSFISMQGNSSIKGRRRPLMTVISGQSLSTNNYDSR